MFLYSAISDSAGFVYPILYVILNPLSIIVGYTYFPTAQAYYFPPESVTRVIIAEEGKTED